MRVLGYFVSAAIVGLASVWFPGQLMGDALSRLPLDFLRESYAASMEQLQSGIGAGTFEISRRSAGRDVWATVIKATTKIYFDKEHYNLRITYEKNERDYVDSRIIITDGTALFANFRSPRDRPTGAHGEIWPFGEFGDTTPNSAGFPLDPRRLPDHVLNVRLLVENAATVKAHRAADGSISGHRVIDATTTLRFLAPAETGFRCTSWDVDHGSTTPSAWGSAKWTRTAGVWYVSALEWNHREQDGSIERTTFSYHQFEPNAAVDSALFTFSSLEIPTGSRIFDRRRDVDVPIYKNTPAKVTSQDKIDKLTEYVKGLPDEQVAESRIEPIRVTPWWRVYLYISGGILTVLGLYLFMRRRRQSDTAMTAFPTKP